MNSNVKFFRVGKIVTSLLCTVLIIELFLQLVCMLWVTLMPDKLAHFFEVVRIWRPFITDMYSFGKATAELCSSMLSYAFAIYFTKIAYDIFTSLEKTNTLPADKIKNVGLGVIVSAVVIPLVRNKAFSVFVNAGYVRDGFNVGMIIIGVVIFTLSGLLIKKEN